MKKSKGVIVLGICIMACLFGAVAEAANTDDKPEVFSVVSWFTTPIESPTDSPSAIERKGEIGYYLASELKSLRITVRYKNPYMRKMDVQVPFSLEIIAPNQQQMRNTPKGTIHAKAIAEEGSFSSNYGWSSAGNWQPGKYTVRFHINNQPSGWGEFYVFDQDSMMAQAETDLQNKNWQDVQAAMENLLKCDRNNNIVAVYLAKAYKEQKQYGQVEKMIQVLQKQNDPYHATFYQGELAYGKGKYTEAMSSYQRAKEISNTDEVQRCLSETQQQLNAIAERKIRERDEAAARYPIGTKVEVLRWNRMFGDKYGYAGIVRDINGDEVTLEVCAFINVNEFIEGAPASGGKDLVKGKDMGTILTTGLGAITGYYRGNGESGYSSRSSDAEGPVEYVNVSMEMIQGLSSYWSLESWQLSNWHGESDSESPGYLENKNDDRYKTILKGYNGAIAGKYSWTATWVGGQGGERKSFSGTINVTGTKQNFRIQIYESGSDAGSGEW